MPKYTNGAAIPLSVAVFLATDDYDYEAGTISATGLIRPLRQIILGGRVKPEDKVVDIAGLLKSRMGTAIHTGIENAWLQNAKQAMIDLGYPEAVADRVVINPDPAEVSDKDIPVYMEQRAYREIEGQRLSGKYDFVAEGRLEDFKSTSVYTFVNGNKDSDYQLQGSIYRWLNPEIITADHMAIQFIFTDWMPGRAATDPKYPNAAAVQHLVPLLSLEETEFFIRQKLREIKKHKDTPEELLPLCNDKDLWRKETAYKYYKNPEKRSRATKNFDNAAEAYARLQADNNVGVVVEVPGEVIACRYCPAFSECKQKDSLMADGSLTL